MNSILQLRLNAREKQDKLEFRQGFLDAVAIRAFKDLPKPINENQVDEKPKSYQRGYYYGQGCALAIGQMPANDEDQSEEFDNEQQFATPAFIGALLFIAGIVVLYATQ